MTALALWSSLFVVSAQTQAVSLVDVLVEGQTLYTMAVDKQPESLTAALDLARQAERAVAADTVRKRLPAGARPNDQDLTVLGALRARITTLTSAIEKRREYFKRQFEDIQYLVHRKRFDDAQLALDRLPADAPTADPVCPFADLRAEIEQGMASRHVSAVSKASTSRPGSGSTSNRKLVVGGIVATAALVGTGVALNHSMNQKYYDMSFLPPGSNQWWNLYDEAVGLQKARNGFYAAAVGVGAAFAIAGAIKAKTSANRSFGPFGPRTFVGFSLDPRRPSIMVVKVF